MTEHVAGTIAALERLAELRGKVTDEPLHESGRYFNENSFRDLTRCGHGDTGNFDNKADGEAIAILWGLWRDGAIHPAQGQDEPVAWPDGFFTLGGDNRLRECTSDGCHQHCSIRVERDGIASDYCAVCARKIARLFTLPAPAVSLPEDVAGRNSDGIPYDEEFDCQTDVEQDPCGAHMAIQAMQRTIEALAAENARLTDELSACTESPGGCGYWREASAREGQRADQNADRAEKAIALADEYYERWNDCGVKLEAANAEVARLKAAMEAWRTAFWVMDGHAVAIHDADGKCYSVRAHDYHVMHDLNRAALSPADNKEGE